VSGPSAYLVSPSPSPSTNSQHIVSIRDKNLYNLLEDTSIQYPLLSPALRQLMVVIFQAVPVGSEVVEAVISNILDATILRQSPL
jgi:hypothetical protein